MLTVVAFDLGQVNFAFCSATVKNVSDIHNNVYKNNNNIHNIHNNEENENFKHCTIGTMALHDFMQGQKTMSPILLYEKLYAYLDTFHELWERTNIILIEQQFVKRYSSNIKALKLSQHVLAYFMVRYHFSSSSKHKKKIIEYASSNKTQVYGKKFALKKDRKQWAVQKVMHDLEMSDPVAHDWFLTFPKKDDIADCVLMIWSFLTSTPPKQLLAYHSSKFVSDVSNGTLSSISSSVSLFSSPASSLPSSASSTFGSVVDIVVGGDDVVVEEEEDAVLEKT